MRRVAALLMAVAAAAALTGSALALDAADEKAGREIVAKQLEAFKADDGEAAFGYAAPSIKGMFGGAGSFLDMVRRSYPPVYRPRTYAFGASRDVADGFEQAVEIQDQAGVDWDAIYSFERQPDGSWKISGCRLVKRPGDAV